MQKQFVLPSKRRVDIVSVVADFRGLLPAGEIIESGTVSVQVFAGVDPNPSEMLDGSIFVSEQQLRHRIKLGVPGVVYQLVFQATTSGEHVIEVECRQAVLVDEMPVEPVYQQFFFTSTPYPIDSIDGLEVGITLPEVLVWRPPMDAVDVVFSPQSGTLRDLLILYVWPPEDAVEVAFEPVEGTLRDILLSYSMLPEAIDITCTPWSGTLKNVLITYSNYRPEGIDVAFTPVGGTLI